MYNHGRTRIPKTTSTSDLFIIFDPVTGKAIHWNKAVEEITGYSNLEIAEGKVPDFYFDSKIHKYLHDFLQEVVDTGNGNIDLELKCKNGKILPISYTLSVLKDATGDSVSIAAVGRKITDSKDLEIAYRHKSEQYFQNLMMQSPNPTEVYDIDGLQIEVNKAYEDLWGFPAERTLNKFNVLQSQEVKDTGLFEYVKRAYEGHTVVVPQYRFNPTGETEARGKGRIRWLSTIIFPLKDLSGKVSHIVIKHDDITDRKDAEKYLQVHEAKQRTMLANITDVLGILDKKGIVLYKSQNITKIFGWLPEDLIGKSGWKLYILMINPIYVTFLFQSLTNTTHR